MLSSEVVVAGFSTAGFSERELLAEILVMCLLSIPAARRRASFWAVFLVCLDINSFRSG